jgi:hypothetical protein
MLCSVPWPHFLPSRALLSGAGAGGKEVAFFGWENTRSGGNLIHVNEDRATNSTQHMHADYAVIPAMND